MAFNIHWLKSLHSILCGILAKMFCTERVEIPIDPNSSSPRPWTIKPLTFTTKCSLLFSWWFKNIWPHNGMIFIITMMSKWARWRFKSPASRLFTQPFIRAQINENIKAPRHWPLCWEFTGDQLIPRTNGQLHGKCFHWMTSTCSHNSSH